MVDVEQLADEIAAKVVERLRGVGDERPLLSTRDLADRLRIAPRTAADLLTPLGSAKIPSFLVGGQRRIAPADFDAYIAAQRNAKQEGSNEAPSRDAAQAH
jgi:DNA-binding transcriptional regulator YhcF (GntR family)